MYAVLAAEDSLTQSEIAERSRLSKRTTRHALSKLTDAEVVDERPSLTDARKRIYDAAPIAEDADETVEADEGAPGQTAADDESSATVGPIASIATGD